MDACLLSLSSEELWGGCLVLSGSRQQQDQGSGLRVFIVAGRGTGVGG